MCWRSNRWRFFFLAAWLGLSTGRAETVVLHLHNGDRLTGTIVTETTNQITVVTAWKEKIIVPLAQIERREKLPPPPPPPSPPPPAKAAAPQASAPAPPRPVVTKEMQRQLDDLLTLYQADKISPAQYQIQRGKILYGTAPVVVATGGTHTAPTAPGSTSPGAATPTQTAAGKPAASAPAAAAKPPKHWTAQINVGGTAIFNQTHTETYTATAQYDYLYKRIHETVNFSGVYSRANNVTAANRFFGSEKTDMMLDDQKRLYVYNLLDTFYDQIMKIDLQYDVGPGLGYHVITKPKYILDLEAGGTYTGIDYSNGQSRNNLFLRLDEKFIWNVNPRTKVSEDFQFFPQQGHFSNYQFQLHSTLSYALSTLLSLNLDVVDFYYKQPAPGATHNSVQINTTIGLKF